MKRDLVISGCIGLVCAAIVYAVASFASTIIPILLQGNLLIAITFVCCLVLSLVEIPMMIFGLRQMSKSATTPHRLVIATFGFYVMFASVYAAIFVLLTGQISWGSALAALALVRLASGIALREADNFHR